MMTSQSQVQPTPHAVTLDCGMHRSREACDQAHQFLSRFREDESLLGRECGNLR